MRLAYTETAGGFTTIQLWPEDWHALADVLTTPVVGARAVDGARLALAGRIRDAVPERGGRRCGFG
jgi:hypothetical protein